MKVILFNGSPKKNGCTYTALCEIEKELNCEGIETLIFHAGAATKGCLGCGYCRTNGKCITDDCVNEAIALLEDADGFIFGSPVHYAAASGMMTSFLDRLFYSSSSALALKPCAVIASCRRGGATATLDQLLKYPEYSDTQKLGQLLGTLEQKEEILDLVSRAESDDINVLIGSESPVAVMNNSSLVFKPIKKNGKTVGVIGVLGPRRMNYKQVLQTIGEITESISSMMDEGTPLKELAEKGEYHGGE